MTAQRLRDAIGVGIGAVLVFAPLAIGTVHPPTQAVVFVGCALLLALTLIQRRLVGKGLTLTAPHFFLLLAVALTALQVVPLPHALVALLSPRANELFEAALGDYRVHALSLDPTATGTELAKLASYLAFYVTVVEHAAQRPRRAQIIRMVAAVAALVAVLGFAQAIARTDALLFFYRPRHQLPALVRGSFVNPNHFGALLTLAAPCALLSAVRRSASSLYGWAAVLVINVASVLTMTRNSMLSVLMAQVIAVLLTLRRERGAWPRSWRSVVIAGVAVAGAIAGAVFSVDYLRIAWNKTLLHDLKDPLWKFQAWGHALSLVKDYPLFGVGRGAFGAAFTQVSPVAGVAHYPWVENAYVQAVADFGIPGAVLLAGLGVWVVVQSKRRLIGETLLVAPFAALVAFACHEAVDFAVEIPGVGLPAIALLAALHGAPAGAVEPRRVAVRLGFLALPVALAVTAVITALIPSASVSGAALADQCRDLKVPTATVVAVGERLRRRHPADYYIPLVVAGRLATEGQLGALRWINASLRLNPRHFAPHAWAADLLARAGRKGQALLEYRAAVAGAPDPRAIWPTVAARYPRLPDLLDATPADPDVLARLAKWLNSVQRSEDSVAVYRRMLEIDPRNVRALQALVLLDLERKVPGQAVERLQTLASLDDSSYTRRLDVRVRLATGDLRSAARVLDAGIDSSAETFALELETAEAQSRAGRPDEARQRLEAVARRWTMDRAMLARTHEVRAAIETRAGNDHQARWELEQRNTLLQP
jgi:hypothetical protein